MTPPDFDQFLSEATGFVPYSWQRELARQVLEEGRWPDTLALPTGSGKTSALFVAVWWMACNETRPPRRLFWVVDRRLVVDSVYDQATDLANKLEAHKNESGALGWTASRLLQLAGEGASKPLTTVRLRGGGFMERNWVDTPLQPTIIASTVDQVGSRLLFRGYGYPRGPVNSLSVQAALVACDALIFVDEAHLSQAFLNTLKAIRAMRDKVEDSEIVGTWQVVTLTATPRPGLGITFPSQHQNLVGDPALAPRLQAKKLASLDTAKDEEDLQEKLVRTALGWIRENGDKPLAVAIVCNRVLRARKVFEKLREEGTTSSVLLTGRMRPVDRDRILDMWLPRIKAGRPRSNERDKVVVVATQAIEVGADLDFDALATEAAPLDALRQRLGRVNRMGELPEAPVAIIALKDQISSSRRPDPIYGEALSKTWDFLSQNRGSQSLDMSWVGMEQMVQKAVDLAAMLSPGQDAPELLPVHLDILAQTSPQPDPDADIEALLHGFGRQPAEVSVVWRADMDPDHPESWAEAAALCPPSVLEALELPIWTVRGWLKGVWQDLADVEGSTLQTEEPPHGRQCLRWNGPDEDPQLIGADDVRPGDTILVPAAYGGCDELGWIPWSSKPVPDIGEEAWATAGRQPALRIHPALLRQWLPEPELSSALEDASALTQAYLEEDLEACNDFEEKLLRSIEDHASSSKVKTTAGKLRRSRRKRIPYQGGTGFLVFEPRWTAKQDSDAASFAAARPVLLSDHCERVASRAETVARNLRLPERIIHALRLAGLYHDWGKAHPRFQGMLRTASWDEASIPEPLAKSGMDPSDRQLWKQAWKDSGLPKGWRHEGLSLTLLEAWGQMELECEDLDLVLHLVASHHGGARPFLMPTPGVEEEEVRIKLWDRELSCKPGQPWRIDSGVSRRFWSLLRRLGWWGLAYLEAILRMSDWLESEQRQSGGRSS